MSEKDKENLTDGDITTDKADGIANDVDPDTEETSPKQKDAANSATQNKANGKRESLYAKNDPDLMIQYEPPKEGPTTVKCPNCGEEMPSTIDTCVNCGHYLKTNKRTYKPMAEDKIKKIRWTIGIICIIAFVIFMIFFRK